MASNSAPLYRHQRNFQPLLNSASYTKSILDEQRQKYSDAENEIIQPKTLGRVHEPQRI
jgi:hypothetical protein